MSWIGTQINKIRAVKNYRVVVRVTMGNDAQEVELKIPALTKEKAMAMAEYVIKESFKVEAVKCFRDKKSKL